MTDELTKTTFNHPRGHLEPCEYCKREMRRDVAPDHPLRATRDHYIPRSKRLETDTPIVVMACFTCNQIKGDRFPEQWDRLHAELGFTALMQGGATGVDSFAREWATRKPEVHRYVCHAEWDKHGKAAGPKRNARMLEWKPDLVIAFPGGRGTDNMIKQAEAAGVPVRRAFQ